MQKKVDVLMATYNGEKYLKEQIESILNQTYKNIQLIISDDCSTDKTREILKQGVDIAAKATLEILKTAISSGKTAFNEFKNLNSSSIGSASKCAV